MKIKLIPPMFFIGFALALLALHYFFPIQIIILPPWTYLGFVVFVLGALLSGNARMLFKKINTAISPYEKTTHLQTTGLYSISRNPMYLGMTLILLGAAIVSGSLTVFVCPLGFALVINKLFIPMEEKNLEGVFGKKYLDYKKKVRRWF